MYKGVYKMSDRPKIGDRPKGNFSKTKGTLIVKFTQV